MPFKKKTKIYLFAYCGEHMINNADPQMPEKGGTGRNGNIKTANTFIVRLRNPSIPAIIDGVELVDGCRIWAKYKKPGQEMVNWVVDKG
jgi:hypothetical protein